MNPKSCHVCIGYDNCIVGVNNFVTESEYLEDLKDRNCTVEDGHTKCY